jgi:cbb3-type cytochrome oxidase maturation protein
MALGVWLIVMWMAFMVLVAGAFILWGWRNGQFRDVEASKYRMLDDRDPAPWTARPTGQGTPDGKKAT